MAHCRCHDEVMKETRLHVVLALSVVGNLVLVSCWAEADRSQKRQAREYGLPPMVDPIDCPSTPGLCLRCRPTRVIDGDTFIADCFAVWGPEAKKGLVIRLAGVDAPEAGGRARCDQEARLAAAATGFVTSWLSGRHNLVVLSAGQDRHGRTLAHVRQYGRDLASDLMAAGRAQPWTGRGPKPTWCDAPSPISHP